MWKPGDVIPENQKKAKWVWATLLAAMFIYIVWQIAAIAIERENPSTSLTLTNDRYNFPFVQVCFWPGQGCGYEDASVCVASALSYEGSVTYGDQEVVVTSGEFTNCVAFDLRDIDIDDPTAQQESGMTSAILTMVWQVADYDDGTAYSESVGVYFGAEKSNEEDMYEVVFLPHGRFQQDGEDWIVPMAQLTIGKTTREFISGTTLTTFPAATIATTPFILPQDEASESLVVAGLLSVTINQGSYSLSNVKDVDPLELGTFLGNLGGFWELLLIMWGLCFIAIRQSDPGLKARNFTKSIQRGTEMVSQRSSISRRASSISASEEGRPAWESAYNPSIAERRGSNNGTSIDETAVGSELRGDDPDASTSAATSRRPVVCLFPQRNSADASGRASTSVGSSHSNYGRHQGDSKVDESMPPPSYGEHLMA